MSVTSISQSLIGLQVIVLLEWTVITLNRNSLYDCGAEASPKIYGTLDTAEIFFSNSRVSWHSNVTGTYSAHSVQMGSLFWIYESILQLHFKVQCEHSWLIRTHDTYNHWNYFKNELLVSNLKSLVINQENKSKSNS